MISWCIKSKQSFLMQGYFETLDMQYKYFMIEGAHLAFPFIVQFCGHPNQTFVLKAPWGSWGGVCVGMDKGLAYKDGFAMQGVRIPKKMDLLVFTVSLDLFVLLCICHALLCVCAAVYVSEVTSGTWRSPCISSDSWRLKCHSSCFAGKLVCSPCNLHNLHLHM